MQSLGTMEVVLRLQRFVIEDRLVGSINKAAGFLARSFADEAVDRQNSMSLDHLSLATLSPGISLGHLKTTPGTPLRSSFRGSARETPGGARRVSHASARLSPAVTPMPAERADAGGHEDDEEDEEDDMHSAHSDAFDVSLPGSAHSTHSNGPDDLQGTPALRAPSRDMPSVLPLAALVWPCTVLC